LCRRLAAGENKGKHDFSDPAYDKVRFSMNDRSLKKSGKVGSALACYGSSLGSNPDISQKYKMSDIVANTL
jgi:hypothetical protein